MSAHERLASVVDSILIESQASVPFDVLVDVGTRVGDAASNVRVADLKEVRPKSADRVFGGVCDQLADQHAEKERHQLTVDLPEKRSPLFVGGQISPGVVCLDADYLDSKFFERKSLVTDVFCGLFFSDLTLREGFLGSTSTYHNQRYPEPIEIEQEAAERILISLISQIIKLTS